MCVSACAKKTTRRFCQGPRGFLLAVLFQRTILNDIMKRKLTVYMSRLLTLRFLVPNSRKRLCTRKFDPGPTLWLCKSLYNFAHLPCSKQAPQDQTKQYIIYSYVRIMTLETTLMCSRRQKLFSKRAGFSFGTMEVSGFL